MPSGLPARLRRVKKAIASQGLQWEAGDTRVGREFEAGTFKGLGFFQKGREPAGGRGNIPKQAFAFQSSSPPTTVDWRAVNGVDWISGVRDQGQCGSCVAFATCATLESRLKILKQDSYFNCELSISHLFFCGAGGNACEEGWQIGDALKQCRDRGVGLEADFRYNRRQQRCKEIEPVVKVLRWRRALEYKERREALYLRGPVIAGMVVYSDFLWYKAGVYRPTTSNVLGLHAVSVIGYDDRQGCWIFKNSWGTAWGEGGFGRIGYGCCGLDAQFPFYDPAVEYVGVEMEQK